MSPDPFPVINAADEGVRHDASYCWDNAARPQSNCCVIQRTLAGEVAFAMNGTRSLVGPGQAFVCTHQERSVYRYPPGAQEPYRFRFLAFLPRSTAPFFETIRREFGSVLVMGAEGEAARLLDEIIAKSRNHDFLDRPHLAELILRLLLAMYREQVAATPGVDPIAYGYYLINDNADGRLSIKEVARLAGVSREYFIREYARRYGQTPGTVLRELRLERARAMLLATSRPLDDIAAACGFGSTDAFRRSFRQQFGRNPLALRQLERGRNQRRHPRRS